MTDTWDINGNPSPDTAEIRFGDAPGNAMSITTAEAMLRLMHANDPEMFGFYAGYALAGVRPKGRNARHNGDGQ